MKDEVNETLTVCLSSQDGDGDRGGDGRHGGGDAGVRGIILGGGDGADGHVLEESVCQPLLTFTDVSPKFTVQLGYCDKTETI